MAISGCLKKSYCRSQSKAKSKTGGVAKRQRHFLCSDKENDANESLALRWACLARGFLVANISGMKL
jgi:hypothetical protein